MAHALGGGRGVLSLQMGDHWLGDSGMVCGAAGGTFQLKTTKSSAPEGSVMILGRSPSCTVVLGRLLSCMVSS